MGYKKKYRFGVIIARVKNYTSMFISLLNFYKYKIYIYLWGLSRFTMKNLFLSFLFSFFALLGYSQALLHCGADEMRINTLKANPVIAQAVIKRDIELEKFTQKFVSTFNPRSKTGATYIIPVVFHVIHNFGTENISDAQILDGLDILNKTFRKQRADTASIVAAFKSLHADCDIEFRLAQIDPNGNCTKGINRMASNLTTLGDHSVKSLIHWPPNKYLNIYIVKNAAGLAGHCVWPSDADTIPAWDGIVIGHNYVGSFGTSTMTQSVALAHECGHYLNLQHIWGGNNVPNFYYYPCADPNKDCNIDDSVADTPPTIGWQSCNLSGHSCGNMVDNVQNAMDYSYCNIMFTYGQKARMHACLNSPIAHRNQLWQTSNLQATGVLNVPGPLCQADFQANKQVVCETGNDQIVFQNTSYNGPFTSLHWSFPGGTPATSTDLSPSVTYTSAGSYPVSLKVIYGTDSVVSTKTDYISVLPATGMPFPYKEDYETINSLHGGDWYANNFDTLNAWELSSTYAYTGLKSVFLNNFEAPFNTKDELISPIIDLAGEDSLTFTFKYAYARKDSSSNDQLQVFITKDCNTIWIPRLTLIGAALETVAPQNTPFFPSDWNDWKMGSFTLPASYYTSLFRFKFLFSSRGGNNLFIDDINGYPLSIEDLEKANAWKLYPNPATDKLYLEYAGGHAGVKTISLITLLGEVLIEQENKYTSSSDRFALDIQAIPAGFYLIKVSDDKKQHMHSVLIAR